MKSLTHRAKATQPGLSASGFSLIELLIVVAIILIIAAIAIPNLLRAKIAANEAATVENVRTITTANVIYANTYGVGFAPGLPNFSTPAAATPVSALQAGLPDDVLVAGTKSGYVFTYAALSPDSKGYFNDYTLNADPLNPGVSGMRHFFANEPAVIRVNQTLPATVTDPSL